jgi:hypothetical protein
MAGVSFPASQRTENTNYFIILKWWNFDHLPGECYVADDPPLPWRILGQLWSERTFPIRNEDQFVKLNGEDDSLVIVNSQHG